ncbi:MAG: ABC transporter permease, partial [Muribaculaceae bacterium]|nr:ABC transporter permease [Muribaculaceae bacterium]
MNLVYKLLQKNISPSRFVGFLVSNFIGLAIIGAGLQFWLDARSIWSREDSFLKSDYLAINKVIDASRTIGGGTTEFSAEEIADIE